MFISLIMCKDKIVIPSILQSYVLYWYHTYILYTGMNRTEAMVCQYFYWPDIRYDFRKKVTNSESCQHIKQSNKNMVNYQLS